MDVSGIPSMNVSYSEQLLLSSIVYLQIGKWYMCIGGGECY